MATTALGIMQDASGNGVDPHTHRKCIQARWGNVGIVTGLAVTGRSDLKYNVAAGVAVTSRSSSDGYCEAYWEGGQTPAVAAGNASNPRIDLVWIKANDLQQGDDDNRVHVGVTSGTPSASPKAPACPAGCTPIAYMKLPANATSTSGAQASGSRPFATPYGATLGRIGYYHDTSKGNVDTKLRAKSTRYSRSVNLPTDRVVELVFTASAYCSGDADDDNSSWYVAFVMDGDEIAYSGGEFYLNTQTCQTVQKRFIIEVPAGSHSFAVVTAWTSGEACPAVRSGSYSSQDPSASTSFSGTFPGRIFEIWDRGIA